MLIKTFINMYMQTIQDISVALASRITWFLNLIPQRSFLSSEKLNFI